MIFNLITLKSRLEKIIDDNGESYDRAELIKTIEDAYEEIDRLDTRLAGAYNEGKADGMEFLARAIFKRGEC